MTLMVIDTPAPPKQLDRMWDSIEFDGSDDEYVERHEITESQYIYLMETELLDREDAVARFDRWLKKYQSQFQLARA